MGCASIAKRSVIPAILTLRDEFKLIAVASRSIDKAKEYASVFNCEAIEGYDQLLQRKDIDVIYMPLPTGLHKEWISKAIKAGKHIYVEKSFAKTYNDAKEIVSLAGSKNCTIMEGYMFQYHSQHQKVFELLNAGTIGNIRSFSASFGFPPLPQDNFRYDKEIGGGALMDCAGYVVRAAFFILGNKIHVCEASVNFDPNTETSIWGNAFMKTNDGIGAFLSFGFDNFYQCNYQILGSKGKIFLKKAFTPKSDEIPILILETNQGVQEYNLPTDNHFIKAFSEFYTIITSQNKKEKHYNDILLQSLALDKIDSLSRGE